MQLMRTDIATQGIPRPNLGGRLLPVRAVGAYPAIVRALFFSTFLAIPNVVLGCNEAFQAAMANPPTSVKIVRHKLHEGPSVVTYDPKAVPMEILTQFARELCCTSTVRINPVPPRLLQRFRKRDRVHIFCSGIPMNDQASNDRFHAASFIEGETVKEAIEKG